MDARDEWEASMNRDEQRWNRAWADWFLGCALDAPGEARGEGGVWPETKELAMVTAVETIRFDENPWEKTTDFVASASIGNRLQAEMGLVPWCDEDSVVTFTAAELAEAVGLGEGCGTMARDPEDTVGAGEFSGVRGRKGRPLTMDAKPLDSEHANLERHHAAFHTNPADPSSGEAQGDANMSS